MESSEAPYEIETHQGYSVLKLYPLINDGQWGNVSQVGTEILTRLEASNTPALVVDLSPLDYMGSAQVALLVRVWKSLKKFNGKMSVQCPGQMVREVLTIAGLKSLWDIVETRDEAVEALGFRPQSAPAPSIWIPLLALLLLAAAGLGLGFLFSNSGRQTLVWGEIALAAAASVVGLVTAIRQAAAWRIVGVVVTVGGVGLAVFTWMKFPPL